MKTQSTVDVELLCSQAPWLRALARHLVRDPSKAEDIAQETLLAALQSPPADVVDVQRLRAWLRRVAYNLSHLSSRRNMRRRAREERVAQQDVQASTADLVLLNSIRVHLADAVGSLDEPYRRTVELRYFEGASTADIALEMGTTDNAVRKRLYRARRKLRQSLDTVHHGDRGAWFSALLPFAVPASPPSMSLGPTTTSKLLPLAIGATGLAAGVLLITTSRLSNAPLAQAGPEVALRENAVADPLLSVAGGRRAILSSEETLQSQAKSGPAKEQSIDQSEPVELDKRDSNRESEETLAAISLHGRVVDLAGKPLAGAPVRIEGTEEPLAWTDSRGGFQLQTKAEAEHRLEVQHNAWTTVRQALISPSSAGDELLIVAARSVDVAGQVVDSDGHPLAGAIVRLTARERAFLAIDQALAGTILAQSEARTDAYGLFALEGVASGDGLFLEAGFTDPAALRVVTAAVLSVPESDAFDLEFRLSFEEAEPFLLTGIVRLEDGTPSPETLVRLGKDSTETDERGSFALRISKIGDDAVLVAEKSGFRQLRFPDVSALVDHDGRATANVGLVLIESTASIVGRVVNSQGEACGGWIVCARTEPEDSEDLEHEGGGVDENASTAVTDGSGRFELTGLVDREHDLVAYDPRNLSTVSADGITSANEELILTLDETLGELKGRVTDEAGRPIAGADVRLARMLRPDVETDSHTGSPHAYAAAVKTDAFGLFLLTGVPTHHIELAVRAAGIERHVMIADGSQEELLIRISEPRSLRIGTKIAAVSFSVLDPRGQTVPLFGMSREGQHRGRLYEGSSILYSTPFVDLDDVVLFDDEDQEVGRFAFGDLSLR